MLTVTNALEFAIDYYAKHYPERTGPVDWINQVRTRSDGVVVEGTGICYQIAKAIQIVIPEAEHTFICLQCSCGDGNVAEYPLHCVLRHEGHYYDTMTPLGADDLFQLDLVIANDVQDEIFLPQSDEDFETFDRCYSCMPMDHFTYKLIKALQAITLNQ